MAWFDAFAQHYDCWYQKKLGSFVDQVQKQLIEDIAEPKANETVLDIGSGTGNYSLWLAQKGLRVSAIDQSQEMMSIAQKKAEKENVKIAWYLEDAQSLPFSDNTFDLVISVTAIEFMDDPKQVLQEGMRALKQNGRLVIGVLTKESPWGELYQKAAEEDPANIFAKAHLYTEKEIDTLLFKDFKLKKGLYIPPMEEFDLETAWETEKKQQEVQAERAGFFVIRWDKEKEV